MWDKETLEYLAKRFRDLGCENLAEECERDLKALDEKEKLE